MTEQRGDLEQAAVILERARELEDTARADYLDDACDGNTSLRREIQALLEACLEQGEFLSEPTQQDGFHGPTEIVDTEELAERAGGMIDRYKLLQRIGEGGFGVVYMAEQQEPVRRKVALKIIKLGMDTKQVNARFEAERQALAMMEHANIARVFDAGATETGRPYFVMELVKGIPITEYCDRNNLSTNERLALFMQVCHAVQHAHQKGVIHRDVKPSNVMVTLRDGVPVPKVIDFGIAKATEQRLTEKTFFTEYHQLVGTPAYMSPEQAEMSELDIDTRTDVYALGVLLYELLTGTTPFDPQALREAAYGEIQRIIREVEPPRPSTRVSTMDAGELALAAQRRMVDGTGLSRLIRGDLDWIVMRALEKDRTRRYETARELATDVQRYLASEPIVAGPPGAIYKLRKFINRNRVVATAGMVVAAILVFGSIASTIGFVQAGQQRDRAQLARDAETKLRELAVLQRDLAIEAEEEAQRQAYVANVFAADASLRFHEVAEAKRRLAACKPDLRGWEWWHLHSKTDRSTLTIDAHDKMIWSVAIGPEGRRIASASADRTIRIWDAESGELLERLLGHQDGVGSVAFSPDGTRIVSGSEDKTVRVWDVASGQCDMTLNGHEDRVGPVAFSPDGSRIVSGSLDATMKLWDATSGELQSTLEGHTKMIKSVVFSSDGTRLVSASLDMTVRLWDPATGAELATLVRYDGGFTYGIVLAFSPDGKRIYTGSWDKVIRVWDATTGEALGTLTGHDHVPSSIAVSRDGSRIVTGSGDATIRISDAESGKELATLVGHEGRILSVAISRDGTTIVSGSADGTVRTWPATPPQWPVTSLHHGRQVTGVALSADGKCAASSARDRMVRIWDADTGDPLRTLEGHSDWTTDVAFSPDGARIASASRDKTVRLWDVTSGEHIRTLEGHQGTVNSVAFDHDGARIASGSRRLRIWDAASGEQVRVIEGAGDWISSLAFSPDGRRIAAISAMDIADITEPDFGVIQIWDADSGEQIANWRTSVGWGSVVFSADGTQVIGPNDGRLQVWDAASGERLAVFTGYDYYGPPVAVFRDGKRIVTGGETVQVWDSATGDALLVLRGHAYHVDNVAVSNDGRRIVSGAQDGSVRIWDTPSDYVPGDPSSTR